MGGRKDLLQSKIPKPSLLGLFELVKFLTYSNAQEPLCQSDRSLSTV